jgi:hypothetical protein
MVFWSRIFVIKNEKHLPPHEVGPSIYMPPNMPHIWVTHDALWEHVNILLPVAYEVFLGQRQYLGCTDMWASKMATFGGAFLPYLPVLLNWHTWRQWGGAAAAATPMSQTWIWGMECLPRSNLGHGDAMAIEDAGPRELNGIYTAYEWPNHSFWYKFQLPNFYPKIKSDLLNGVLGETLNDTHNLGQLPWWWCIKNVIPTHYTMNYLYSADF